MEQGVRAYICSPLSAETDLEVEKNMQYARACMKEIRNVFGYQTYAPHAYLPELLDDHDPEERALALSFAIELLTICQVLIICGTQISKGMEAEIKKAFQGHIAVFRYLPGEKHILVAINDWRQLNEMQVSVENLSE